MSRKRTVEKIDGFKSRTKRVVQIDNSNYANAVGLGGAPCPVYPFDKSAIDNFNCQQLKDAKATMDSLRTQAYNSQVANCSSDWESLNSYIVTALNQRCGTQTGGGTPCTGSVSNINVSVSGSTATITPSIVGASQYNYILMPTLQKGTQTAGNNVVFSGLSDGKYTVSIEPSCGSSYGVPMNKEFTIAASSGSSGTSGGSGSGSGTTTITTTTTSTPIIGGIGGMFGGGFGQELSDQGAAAPKKSNWLFWVLVAGAVYLFTRKKKKD